jgi:hypothetical protein
MFAGDFEERQWTATGWHDITSQKVVLFIITSNPTFQICWETVVASALSLMCNWFSALCLEKPGVTPFILKLSFCAESLQANYRIVRETGRDFFQICVSPICPISFSVVLSGVEVESLNTRSSGKYHSLTFFWYDTDLIEKNNIRQFFYCCVYSLPRERVYRAVA